MSHAFDERAFVHRAESTGAHEFACLIERASPEEEHASRASAGGDRFERMQRLAG
jgi:hypothetical protein